MITDVCTRETVVLYPTFGMFLVFTFANIKKNCIIIVIRLNIYYTILIIFRILNTRMAQLVYGVRISSYYYHYKLV